MLIAEISQNFNNLKEAKELTRLAKENGADIVKAQLFDSTKLYGEQVPSALTFEHAGELFEYGKSIGIEVFYSVFDIERFGWCEKIGVKRYKVFCGAIPSEVLNGIHRTGKPCYLSFRPWGIADTGSVPDDLMFPGYSWRYMDYIDNFKFGLWKALICPKGYPQDISDYKNWGVERGTDYNNWFVSPKFSGISDHTIGLDFAKRALWLNKHVSYRGSNILDVALGRRTYHPSNIIEKHFAFKHTGTPDAKWSMTPEELRELVEYRKELDSQPTTTKKPRTIKHRNGLTLMRATEDGS